MYELRRKRKRRNPESISSFPLFSAKRVLGAAGSRFRYFPEVLAAEASRRIRRHCSGICRSISECVQPHPVDSLLGDEVFFPLLPCKFSSWKEGYFLFILYSISSSFTFPLRHTVFRLTDLRSPLRVSSILHTVLTHFERGFHTAGNTLQLSHYFCLRISVRRHSESSEKPFSFCCS